MKQTALLLALLMGCSAYCAEESKAEESRTDELHICDEANLVMGSVLYHIKNHLFTGREAGLRSWWKKAEKTMRSWLRPKIRTNPQYFEAKVIDMANIISQAIQIQMQARKLKGKKAHAKLWEKVRKRHQKEKNHRTRINMVVTFTFRYACLLLDLTEFPKPASHSLVKNMLDCWKETTFYDAHQSILDWFSSIRPSSSDEGSRHSSDYYDSYPEPPALYGDDVASLAQQLLRSDTEVRFDPNMPLGVF
jgi:hypothetical protein